MTRQFFIILFAGYIFSLLRNDVKVSYLELVSKDLNHLAAILHACLCRGFEFYEVKKFVIIFQKENGNTFTLLIIFIVKSLQKEKNSTNLLL
jgi:hypothetical protein